MVAEGKGLGRKNKECIQDLEVCRKVGLVRLSTEQTPSEWHL